MEAKENSYKQIFKATSIFGGVQVFNIIIQIVRSKFIAILLGPAGMGIATVLTTTIGLVTNLTSFGLGRSAVKNVAVSYGTGNEQKLSQTVIVFRKLVWFTGLLGFILTLIFAAPLSEFAFGNNKFTLAFVLLSVTLLITQLTEGQSVILRGTRKVAAMAKASLIGAVAGLFISIPLYYFFGNEGIVPAIIFSAVATLIITYFFAKQVDIPKVKADKAIMKTEGKEMLKMGVLISLSGIISSVTSYLVTIFISHTGGVEDVGFYNAGFAIISSYVGMVFTAMSVDYYPRLAAVASDNIKSKKEINQQAEIAILILAPILILFLVFIHFGIILLYASTFLEITDMVQWAAMGIFFKACSWAIGMIFVSKGHSRAFFVNELITNVYLFGLNILGYYYFGLTGLGISFLVGYFLHFLQMYIVCNKLYQFTFDHSFLKVFAVQFMFGLATFLIVSFVDNNWSYFLGSVFILVSIYFSWKEINKRIDITGMLKTKFLKM